jgi:hypothetical protein
MKKSVRDVFNVSLSFTTVKKNLVKMCENLKLFGRNSQFECE